VLSVHELVSGSRKSGGWKPKGQPSRKSSIEGEAMNTSPNPMTRTSIMRRLNEIIDYHLFEPTSWPANDAEVRAFWRTLEEMGLTEGTHFTDLGIEHDAPLTSYFIGAHELMEIPMKLAKEGLIEDWEADDFYSSSEEENIIQPVEALARLACLRMRKEGGMS
jgi:hypothetical protein